MNSTDSKKHSRKKSSNSNSGNEENLNPPNTATDINTNERPVENISTERPQEENEPQIFRPIVPLPIIHLQPPLLLHQPGHVNDERNHKLPFLHLQVHPMYLRMDEQ